MSRANAVRFAGRRGNAGSDHVRPDRWTGAGSAHAATNLDGRLESGELGLSCNPGGLGCVWDSYYDDNTFVGDNFKAPYGGSAQSAFEGIG